MRATNALYDIERLRPAMTVSALPRLRRLLDPPRQHRPVGAGPQPLQEVHEAGVVADQDARGVFLDALDDAQRGGRGRGPGERVEPLDRFARGVALSVMPLPVRELRAMLVATPPGCTTDSRTGLAAIASSCRRLSEKPRTANFAAA